MMLVSDLMVAKHKRSKNSNYFDLPEELDDGWIRTHQETLVELERQKITKKFGRDNDKLIAANEKEMKPSELESRLEAAADLEKKFKLETRTNKIRPEPSNITLEKLESKINGIDGQLGNALLQAEDKESNKEVALNTSRIVSWNPMRRSRPSNCMLISSVFRTTSTHA